MNLSRFARITMLLALAGAAAAEAPPIPPPPGPYAAATPEVRDYLEQARKADFMTDGLERCLAWPALPGQRWPEGLVEAHCTLRYGPRLTLAELAAHVGKRDFKALERRLQADLDAHDGRPGASEAIHSDFFAFDAGDESGRLTEAWVAAAPRSAFAHTARGHYFLDKAQEARGGAVARDTPRGQFARMEEYAELSVAEFERAVELDPAMIEAHVGLIRVARLDSRNELAERAMQAARALDPGCYSWADSHMYSLLPKWGGSIGEMRAFARTLAAHAGHRPLLVFPLYMAQVEAARELRHDERFRESLALSRELMQATTEPYPYRDAGLSMVHLERSDPWERLMFLLGEGRFPGSHGFAARERARLLYEMVHDNEWAALVLQRAVDAEPDNAYGQLMLGTIRADQGRLDEAEKALVAAMGDSYQRRQALYTAAATMMDRDQVSRARRYIDTLTSEYPDFAWGWFMLGFATLEQQGGVFQAGDAASLAFDRFERTADSTDPAQLAQLTMVRGMRKAMADAVADGEVLMVQADSLEEAEAKAAAAAEAAAEDAETDAD